jgi:hypothetical protein
MKRYFSIVSVLIALLLGTLACQLTTQPTTVVHTVIVQATAVPPVDTPTPPQEASPTPPLPTSALPVTGAEKTDTPAPPTPTAGPMCTVLKNTNFRKGPGTAYQPPLRALKTGAQVIPQGFNVKGFPFGSWVQALEPAENQIGWLSVDPQLITCNIDLTTLPEVAVEPPPPPPAPVVSNTEVDGVPNGLVGKVHFSSNYLMRMEVRAPDGDKDGDGIKRVTFTISDGNGTVYRRTEENEAYCIFGGGEPSCNPWTQVNGQYLWKDGGQPVKDGTYSVLIEAEPTGANGDESQLGKWFFSITLDVP